MSIIMYKQRFMPPTDRFTPIRNYLHIGYIAMRPRSMKNEDGVHGLFGYLFYTSKYPNEIGQPYERETFFAQSDAAWDFAIKSGLVDERRLFTEKELAIIFVSSIESRIAPGNDWCSDEIESLDGIIEKIESIMPELGGYPVTAELKAVRDAEFAKGIEP